MKKILMLVTMVMMLAFSAVCSASNGKVLDAEEALAAKFLTAGNYKAVSALMTPEMQKNWDEKAYSNFQSTLANDFGKVNTNQLIVVEKHKNADVLLYQVAAEKVPAARFVYLFKLNGEKPLQRKNKYRFYKQSRVLCFFLANYLHIFLRGYVIITIS